MTSTVFPALDMTDDRGNPTVWMAALRPQNIDDMGVLLPALLDVNGWQGDVHALCDVLPVGDRPIGLQDILAIMTALGYRVRQDFRHASSLAAIDCPGLFVPDSAPAAAVVLREMGEAGAVCDDGRLRVTLPEGDGIFFRFERKFFDDAPEELTTAEPVSWVSQIIERFRPILWHAAILSLVMHLFTLAMPLFSMAVYDRVISAHAVDTLPLLACGVVAALLMEGIIRWIRIRLAGWVGARCGVLATGAMFERLLFLPASVIEQASVSAQLARIRAFESVRDFVTGPMFLTLLEVPFILVLIFVVAMLAGPVAWVPVGIVLLQVVMVFALKPQWRRLGRETAHASAQRQQLLMDIIDHLKPLYAAGMNQRMLERFKAVSLEASRAHYRFGMSAAIVQHMGSFFTVAAGIATISWSLERIWQGEMTGGAMVATMIITWRILYPLQALCAILPHLEQIRASLLQAAQLMALVPEAHAAHVVLAEHPLKGHVQLQNIGLRYGRKSDPVFMGLSGDIAAGDIVALYGSNGSGKSSILRLLLGLYAPTMGSIRLDGVDHRQFDPRSLRRQIAYLPQMPELIPGTIADNLRAYNPTQVEFALRHALLRADALTMVEQLPDDIHTVIGQGFIPPHALAARLCLARLYLADCPLVLCDELPGQIVNSRTGERFREYLAESRGKRTVLFVTHRQDWLSVADKVIWFKPDGRPVMGKPHQAPAQINI